MLICTFAGHRNILHANIRKKLHAALEMLLIRDNDFCFYLGNMGEFDNLCATELASLKRNHPDKRIRVICTEPYMKSAVNVQNAYPAVFDEIVIPACAAESHYKQAIRIRNRWMVEQSSCIITYVHRDFGGAYETLQYARKLRLEILELLQDPSYDRPQ